MKLFLKKLHLRLLLFWYNLEIKFDDFLERFSSSNVDLDMDSPRIMQERQNHRLTRAIAKITKAIYDENGKLRDFAKQRGFDMVSITKGAKRSPIEEIKIIDIQRRVLDNPIDESGTDDALVNHAVKNAPRYVLEQERRALSKEYVELLRQEQTPEVTKLAKEKYRRIQELGSEIKRLKEKV